MSDGSVIADVTDATFQQEVADFKEQVKFAKINVDNSPGTASQHGVQGVPAMFFYRNGTIVDQAVGTLSKNEIEQRIRTLL